jgi:hypothetical protein
MKPCGSGQSREDLMRWLYLDPPREEDLAVRDHVFLAIEAFWEAFSLVRVDVEGFLEKGGDFDMEGWMERYLGAIHPDLKWEIGDRGDLGWRLTITPESRLDLSPMVNSVLENGPEIPNWEFVSSRPADAVWLHETVEGRCGHDTRGLRGVVRRSEGNLLEVGFHLPLVTDGEAAGEAAFLAAETLFGERILATWIRGVGYALDAEDIHGWMEPEELVEQFEMLRQEILDGLPEEPCYRLRDQVPWHAIEFEPEEMEDYPEREDLIGMTTMELEAFKSAHGLGPFFSERFSRLGEVFCYLKLEHPEDVESPENVRVELEEKLHEALASQELGGHIGGGMGLRYAYIDLALMDVKRSLPVIRRIFAPSRLGSRCWLLFFDETLRGEWVGLREDSPSPPMSTQDS